MVVISMRRLRICKYVPGSTSIRVIRRLIVSTELSCSGPSPVDHFRKNSPIIPLAPLTRFSLHAYKMAQVVFLVTSEENPEDLL